MQYRFLNNGFERSVNSFGLKTFSYGNATHAFADILLYMKDKNNNARSNGENSYPNIIMPSFIPAKLFRIILTYGYTPRFYQIDESCQFNINEINELICPGTKAIFAVHYFGYPAKIKELRELADAKNIILIEDCAHVIPHESVNEKLGTTGDFTIFSPRKMLNLPEGGYLVLNKQFEDFEPSYTERVSSYFTLSKLVQTRGKYFYLTLTNGSDIFNISKIPQRGFMDYGRIQKTLIKKMSRLSEYYSKSVDIPFHIKQRQQNYSYLFNGIKKFSFLTPLYDDSQIDWTPYSLPVIVEKGWRDVLQTELNMLGISCGAGWPESPFDKRLKKTLELSENLIEFPVHPFVIKEQLNKILEVCGKLEKRILKEYSAFRNVPVPVFADSDYTDAMHNYVFKGNGEEKDDAVFKVDDIKIRTITTDEEFDDLGDEWKTLCEESNTHIFQTFEWQRLWWKYYGVNKRLHLLLFYLQNDFYEEKLIGIAPFFIDEKYLFGHRVISRLRLIGSGVERSSWKQQVFEYGVSDYLDLIIVNGYEETVANKLAGCLKKKFSLYETVQLDEVRTDSAIFKYLLPHLKDSNLQPEILRSEICPRIIVPETIDKYFKQLKPTVRSKLKKVRRDITGHSFFKINKIKYSRELSASFRDFIHLHQNRWNRLGLLGMFADEAYEHFLEEVSYAFLERQYLHFTTLYSNNECIAAQCTFKYKNTYYDYLKAFNDQSQFAKYKPGKALLALLIEDAIEQKLDVVDLLRGNESYKFEFATEWQWIYKIVISDSSLSHKSRYMLFKLIRLAEQTKRRAINESHLISVQIKNFGITGFTRHYFPALMKRIKNKLYKDKSF
ncbi:MAG: GNAT family N-acetyltransferase [Bacteroidota bacterium]